MNAEQRNKAKAAFLESLSRDPNISLACDCAEVSRDAVYKWRDKDQQFAKDWDQAIERTKDIARSAFYQRAVYGWLEPTVSAGQVAYDYEPDLDDDGDQKFDSKGKPMMKRGDPVMTRKYSDSLAVLFAKTQLPEYKEKQHIDLNANINGKIDTTNLISIDTRSLSPEQLIKLKALAIEMKGGQ